MRSVDHKFAHLDIKYYSRCNAGKFLLCRNMKNQQKMNERELSLGLTGTSSSWHREYEDSAWVYVGGLPYDLTEGDVICVFSQ